jgi:hypothetical protein
MRWTGLLIILALLICSEAALAYAMSATPGFYRPELLHIMELGQESNHSAEGDKQAARYREIFDHNRRVSYFVLALFSANTLGLTGISAACYSLYRKPQGVGKFRAKNDFYSLAVFVLCLVGWAATYGVCTLLKNWGPGYSDFFQKPHYVRTFLIVLEWTIIPFLILPVISHRIKFPEFGNWLLCAAAFCVAAFGVCQYALHMGDRGEWAGFRTLEIPFMQCYVIGLAVLVALLSKFAAFVNSRIGRKEVPEIENYNGPRCIACRSPIESGATLCPSCGWTQPG